MRLLVLTHTFPPSRIANAKRPGYLVKGFLQAGWQVDVFTSPMGVGSQAAESISHPALKVFRRTDPVERFCASFAGRPALFRAFSLAVNGALWPDEHLFWSVRAMRFARAAGAYDCVLSFVLPASLFLTGVPPQLVNRSWIFDLQESVTPFFRAHPRRSPFHRLLLPLLRRVERRALHKAGRVVFTADTNRQAYIQQGQVPEANTAHIPYFFDAEEFQGCSTPISNRFQIAYFGFFDWRGARNPRTFLHCLARFLQRTPEARPHTEFLFHGNWLAEHNVYLDELKLRDIVSLQSPVPYAEYISKVRQSPVLLLVVASAHNLFMPSKIVDYLGAQRPILAFVPRNSEMANVLGRAGMGDYTCDEFDIEAGTVALEKLWKRHQSGTLDCENGAASFWSSHVQLPRYLDIVANAL